MIVFLLLVMFAAVGALLAFKKSTFYKMWATLFNITIAIYLSVMFSGAVTGMIPEDIAGIEYQKAACILGIAVIIFGILQSISVSFITSGCDITFPGLLDNIGTSLLGFLSGWLVMSFLLFLICIMPFSRQLSLMHCINGSEKNTKTSVAPVVTVCNFVSNISLQRYRGKAQEVVYHLTIKQDTFEKEKTDSSINEQSPLYYLKNDQETE